MKLVFAAVVGGLLCCPTAARAELVFFNTGQMISVKAHRIDGGLLVLTLRGGGEMSIDRVAVARIAPDEVPHPEDDPAPLASSASTDPLLVDPRYAAMIDMIAAREGVSARLVRAVIHVESRYRASARSRKGAMGLMQLMPETARQYAVANPYEPQSNIEAGIKYLKSLLQRFELPLALAAYNAGEAAVKRFNGIPPYPETRRYVADILKLVDR